MSEEFRNAIEASTAWAATKAMFAGAFTSIAGVVTSSTFVGLLGVCVALLGLLVNWYFKARADRREEAEWKARMKKLRTAPSPLEDS